MKDSSCFSRQSGLIGKTGQRTLGRARVLVAGLGGVGGLCAELLARAGVGSLVLLDSDRFEESNLNRQLHAKTTNVGRHKAAVLAHHLDKVRPGLKLTALTHHLEPAHGARLEALVERFGALDLVVDALDSVPARVALFRLCKRAGVPYAYAAATEARGMVSVLEGAQDLEAWLRLPSKGKPEEELESSLVHYPQCRSAWGPATNLVGCLAANAALNRLLKKPYPRAPRAWMVDAFGKEIVREEGLG